MSSRFANFVILADSLRAGTIARNRFKRFLSHGAFPLLPTSPGASKETNFPGGRYNNGIFHASPKAIVASGSPTMTPLTPSLPPIDKARLIERFLQYVAIGTASDPNSQQTPSTPGQLVLGELLARQLKQLGAEDVQHDAQGRVWGTIPATIPGQLPTILLNAHLDTSPEAPGDGVNARVIESYSGGPIGLGQGNLSLTPQDCPELDQMIGSSLIVTDGTTLLGGDDKAGIAVIMEVAQTWIERPYLPHGPIRILFTCDEEIGKGAHGFDPRQAGATVGYTLDGGGEGTIDEETFSADLAIAQLRGINIHPSIAKGKMVNAVRAASLLVSMLPVDWLSPESSDGRQGFVHPYEIRGSVAEATVSILLRDFDTLTLQHYAKRLEQLGEMVQWRMPGLSIEWTIRKQYRNMADGLRRLPESIQLAKEAFGILGRPCRTESIRGGTDGAAFTELGLPTPNLSCGQHMIHSVKEFVCVDQMVRAAEHLVVLAERWSQHGAS